MSELEQYTSEQLNRIFAKADASLKNFLNIDPDRLDEIQKASGDKFKKDFLSYIKQELDLLKILNLLINAPYGLTKAVIGQYVMADKYKGKVASAEEEKKKIMKNLNYIEKNIAHLSALLYMFFPCHRNALGIVRESENTKAKAFRYRFNDFETARKIFSDLVCFDGELAVTYAITEKTRNEIAEACIEDVAKEQLGDSIEDKANYIRLLTKISKAIAEHTLCEIETEPHHYSEFWGECDYDDYGHEEDNKFLFLPLMIRDATETVYDMNNEMESDYNSKEVLYKYLHMDSVYIVHGLIFSGTYKGKLTEAEWFRNATAISLRLSDLKTIKLRDNLSESKLKLSDDYKTYTGDLYKLNPYRNLCGDDFFLLLPSSFLNKLPSNIKQNCFNFQEGGKGLESNAAQWIDNYIDYLSSDPGWREWDLVKFNFDYFEKDEKYSLVKCTNYVELLHQLNFNHVVLPECTLPRELVDRQNMLFIRSMLSRNMLASPHQKQIQEKAIRLNSVESVIPAEKVSGWSQSVFEKTKIRAYLSKFNYMDYEMLLMSPNSDDVFCKEICVFNHFKDDVSVYDVGIPLCCSEQNGRNYLIFWDYRDLVKQISISLNTDNKESDIEKLEQFILATQLDKKNFPDNLVNTDLELKCLPLFNLSYLVELSAYEIAFSKRRSFGEKGGFLSDKAKSILMNYVEKGCRPNPKLDDITRTKRTYHVVCDTNAFGENLFMPDCFDRVEIYFGARSFEKYNKVSELTQTVLARFEEQMDIRIIIFETSKRSEVIRFLHENMGRVFYLDVSESNDDPLGVRAELEQDCKGTCWTIQGDISYD